MIAESPLISSSNCIQNALTKNYIHVFLGSKRVCV